MRLACGGGFPSVRASQKVLDRAPWRGIYYASQLSKLLPPLTFLCVRCCHQLKSYSNHDNVGPANAGPATDYFGEHTHSFANVIFDFERSFE